MANSFAVDLIRLHMLIQHEWVLLISHEFKRIVGRWCTQQRRLNGNEPNVSVCCAKHRIFSCTVAHVVDDIQIYKVKMK